ncbi:hypothetical protein NDU88_002521 [Pleurodeles waltl]|uniref:Uncharacterized protein n=1 Tax=Pleurodeles waltl TaxID=8319 RepID=A0AAV7KZ71_PLEWA|nr:hypothetical protein NDU88_002521 [Pleurodeles waltl]
MQYVSHLFDRLDYIVHGVPLSVFPPQVSAHQKKGLWSAITKDVWILESIAGGAPTAGTVGGPETLGPEDCGGSAGDGIPTREGCTSEPDPLTARILAEADPELDGGLRAAQQPKGGEYSVCGIHFFVV